MLLLFTVFILSPLRSAMLSIIAKPTTASTVLGTLMMPKRHPLDSLAWDNISPAKNSVRQKSPTPANLPQQESGEPRDPRLT